jgi:C4-type Zn-finger protein
MEPTKEQTAICCICDKTLPESQGTYSVPYEDKDESGAFFICNPCQQMEDATIQQEDEAIPEFPVDWDEGQEDEDNP